ncbi:MAG: phosphatidate cytidylyltransferase [Elusimicrobia bacterium]|nr:phosphatidate cytidylyltransferase [Elusimicrobiota bacterium]
MLLPRVLTALAGVPLLLFVIHWGGWSFSFLVLAVCCLSLYEYGMILRIGRKPVQRLFVILAGLALALCLILSGPLNLTVSGLMAAIVLREMFSSDRSLERMALTIFGAVLLGWMPAHLALIRDLRPHGEKFTFLFFLVVWAMDSAAYFVGRKWGGRKLAEGISPKKTWAGAAAGFSAAALLVFCFRAAEPLLLSRGQAAALALIIGAGGQLSDLAESMIKRAVGAKDSGNLLPGHGGVMDRFDSFLLTAPAVYYCLQAFIY